MSAGAEFLTIMVLAALAVTTLAPLVLLTMLIRDWKKGQLW